MAMVIIGIVAVLLLLGLVLRLQKSGRDQYVAAQLAKVDQMAGALFEQYIAGLLDNCGYAQVQVTQESGDYGADIIAYDKDEKIAVQCKRCQANIGVKAVQEIIGGMQFYDCAGGIVVTNSYFTRPAQELAAKCQVELWDRDTLKEIIKR